MLSGGLQVLLLLLASSLDTTAGQSCHQAGDQTLKTNLSAVENFTITPMFDDPVVVLEGQPLRVAFQTNLDIKSGVGTATKFVSDPQGGNAPPDLPLEVGNSEWLPFPTVNANGHTRPDNWRMKWYRGLTLTL